MTIFGNKNHGTVSQDFDLSSSITGDLGDFFSILTGSTDAADPSGKDWGGDLDMVRQEALDITHGFNLELSDAESSIIRWAERDVTKKRRGGPQTPEKTQYVTHEDFEPGTQRDAFLLIYGYAETLFSNQNLDLKRKALNFFFRHKANDDFTFSDAATCIDPSIRVDVIQLRILFEFWVRDWHVKLPDFADNLPDRVMLAASQYAANIGVSIAAAAWYEPGIELSGLIETAGRADPFAREPEIMRAIQNLVAYHVVSEGRVDGVSRYYTTGKNPILKLEEILSERSKVKTSLDKLHWSRLF